MKELDLQAFDAADSEMVNADEELEAEESGSEASEEEEEESVDESDLALAEIVRQQVAKQMEAKSKTVSKKTVTKPKKTKTTGNSALLPAKVKNGPSIAEAFSRLKLNLSLAEVMMVKPEVHEAMELLVADISVRTGRPIMTVEGVAT